MAEVFEHITDHLRTWVARQPMFFVATAPLAADGLVNVSPKGPPRIARFHGTGRAVRWNAPEFAGWMERCAFEDASIAEVRRSAVVVDVHRVSDSCGWGMSLMSHVGTREHHEKHSAKRLRLLGPDGFEAVKRRANPTSLDGLPAVS